MIFEKISRKLNFYLYKSLEFILNSSDLPQKNENFLISDFTPLTEEEQTKKERLEYYDALYSVIPKKFFSNEYNRNKNYLRDLECFNLKYKREGYGLEFWLSESKNYNNLIFLKGFDDFFPMNDLAFHSGYLRSTIENDIGGVLHNSYSRQFKNQEEFFCFINQVCREYDFSSEEKINSFLSSNLDDFLELNSFTSNTDSLFVAKYLNTEGNLCYAKITHNYRASSSQFFWINRLKNLKYFPNGNPLRVCLNGYNTFDLIEGLAVTTSFDANSVNSFDSEDLKSFKILENNFKNLLTSNEINNYFPDFLKSFLENNKINIDDDSYLQKILIRTLIQQASRIEEMKSKETDYLYFLEAMPSFDDIIIRNILSGKSFDEIRSFSFKYGQIYNNVRFNCYIQEKLMEDNENSRFHYRGISDIDINSENFVYREDEKINVFFDPLLSTKVPLHGFIEDLNHKKVDLNQVFIIYYLASKLSANLFNLDYEISEKEFNSISFSLNNWRTLNSIKIGGFKLLKNDLNKVINSMNF